MIIVIITFAGNYRRFANVCYMQWKTWLIIRLTNKHICLYINIYIHIDIYVYMYISDEKSEVLFVKRDLAILSMPNKYSFNSLFVNFFVSEALCLTQFILLHQSTATDLFFAGHFVFWIFQSQLHQTCTCNPTN